MNEVHTNRVNAVRMGSCAVLAHELLNFVAFSFFLSFYLPFISPCILYDSFLLWPYVAVCDAVKKKKQYS